ncbi:MAG: lamin tail domain-containing protein [Candidatus Liptonbacteria bacterium]|nr:lamin tail domain-containing protein [Candidatus Liptonbacteria bacterium]
MLRINEFLPNPAGKDTAGEFIELYNSGFTPINLSGFSLRDKSGKVFKLSGSIEPQSFRIFWRKETKISLNNINEKVFLFDNSGALLQGAGFLGEAKEGASFSFVAPDFIFSNTPTPGAPNQAGPIFRLTEESRFAQAGDVVRNNLSLFNFMSAMIFVALLFGLGSVYLLKFYFAK